mgnify:CR=1 FL=1
MSSALGEIEIQILWNRLIAVCEEQAQVMIRAAFTVHPIVLPLASTHVPQGA